MLVVWNSSLSSRGCNWSGSGHEVASSILKCLLIPWTKKRSGTLSLSAYIMPLRHTTFLTQGLWTAPSLLRTWMHQLFHTDNEYSRIGHLYTFRMCIINSQEQQWADFMKLCKSVINLSMNSAKVWSVSESWKHRFQREASTYHGILIVWLLIKGCLVVSHWLPVSIFKLWYYEDIFFQLVVIQTTQLVVNLMLVSLHCAIVLTNNPTRPRGILTNNSPNNNELQWYKTY